MKRKGLKSAAPFFNQSNCIIYALIQSEMEPQTLGPSVRNNAIFKTMCPTTKPENFSIAPNCLPPSQIGIGVVWKLSRKSLYKIKPQIKAYAIKAFTSLPM